MGLHKLMLMNVCSIGMFRWRVEELDLEGVRISTLTIMEVELEDQVRFLKGQPHDKLCKSVYHAGRRYILHYYTS
jgi:hypothetical protein